MKAIIYQPGQPEQPYEAKDFTLDTTADQIVLASTALRCSPEMVDILASGKNYLAYSVFDDERDINIPAMQVLTDLTGFEFNITDEDMVLRGPVLVVTV